VKKEIFDELIESINEATDIMKGAKKPSRIFELNPIDIRNIRLKYNLTQDKFASNLGISLGTLKNWEQGRRNPTGPAYKLLKIAEKHPEIVFQNL
jgi:putative transcriptional regulator